MNALHRNAFLVGLAALVYAAVLARITPFMLEDEGYLYYIAWRVHQGAALFRDVELFTYTPGVFHLWAGWFDLFGVSTASARALGVAFAALNGALTYVAARRLHASNGLAVLAAAAAAVGAPLLFRGHLPLLNLVGLLLAFRAVEDRRRRSLGALAAFTVLAAAIRVDAAITCAGLTGAAVLLRLDLSPRLGAFVADAAVAAGAAALSGACVFLALSTQGTAMGWVGQLVDFVGFAGSRSVAWYKLPFPAFGVSPRQDLMILLMLSSLAVVAGVALSALIARGEARSATWRRLALLVPFGLANIPQFLVERPDASHLADHGFALVLLATALAASAPLPPAVRSIAARRLVAAVCVVWILAYAAWGARDTGAATGLTRNGGAPATLAGEQVRVAGPEVARALEWLDKTARPDEPIASLPFEPGVNFLLRRPLPSRHVYFMPFSSSRPGSEQDLARALTDPELRFLVLAPGYQVAPDPRANLGCYAPAVGQAIASNFHVRAEAGGYLFMEKLGRADPGFGRCPLGPRAK